ncbi:MAG: 4Fe-4S dicluster domain-containing protein [Dysgonamonadaceae bacterium]|jgi:ferredoxin|nr:4Fe-4S dicluster domain-containing protein [Dysgonamonadaceae bacterium]
MKKPVGKIKIFRLILALVLFSVITFYFIDFAGLLPNHFHVLAHLQFVPAWISGSVLGLVIVLIHVVLTLLFGRLYCAVLCPMGVYQDVVAWVSKRVGKKKKKYCYSRAKSILRWSVVGVFIIFSGLGWTAVAGLTDPYSAYGRMAVHIFRPVYMAGNNLLESIFTPFNNYTFYKTDIFVMSAFSFATAIVTMLIVGYLAWRHGRTYCNTFCPVGTALGLASRFALFKIRIDRDKCTHCGLCAMKCKASCIDSQSQTVDASRCVDCFNCLDACSKGALKYSYRSKSHTNPKQTASGRPENTAKRRFLWAGLATVTAGANVLAQQTKSLLADDKKYTRQTPIAPPGAVSSEHLLRHCTSCHLCISKCPSHVIKPSFLEYGIGGIMQPVMSYEKGFCNYHCSLCSEICPNGALKPLTKEEKQLTQIGYVVFNPDICVVITNGTNCGACSEHCPTQAVKMLPYKDGLTLPSIDTSICVGCGGCEYICPVRPHTAIFVEGHAVQQQAKAFEEEEKTEVTVEDFGF